MKNKLSIYLIKESITDINNIFKDNLQELHEYTPDKKVYFVGSHKHPPTWLKAFLT